MYCNFTKCHAIPTAIRASSQHPICFLHFYINPKPSQLLPFSNLAKPLSCSRVRKFSTGSIGFIQHVGNNRDCFANGVYSKPRKFSTSYSRKAVEGSDSVKSLPWLAKNKDSEVKDVGKSVVTRRSSWEESAERFTKSGREKVRRKDFKPRSKVLEDELTTRKVNRSSWEESAEKYGKNGVESKERGRRFDERSDFRERRYNSEDESDVESEETDNPKWYKIQDRFDRFDRIGGAEQNPKFNRQDNWGKKVWKEASESSVPKMIGECVYGVGPVLAALSASRREFYVLYVQEGIDLSGNNKKKKDKKGFEKVLKFADQLGLTKKEISKHDLNMIADNRPHQGLVLDASPLEMVNIRQLDRVVESEGDECFSPLWLALDEVMDPQNLGAIIRSAYFFGASGVVLCAKNSAPLSGVVSKASAGSLELTELRSCKNMMQFLVSSAENGWRVLGGSVSSRSVAIDEVTTGEPTILVLGSEGTGLRPLVERSCTQLVKIPGNSPVHLRAGLDDAEPQSFIAVESLNVSVAAGVLLHHLAGSKKQQH
ncbi:hypothetical protein QVD17_26491 [Tagetes erecta]|uniref:rRNA methyltransferase 1, mitochondrial n=1 Tax=Tagetes erecta TaxID=13708 RepID=A0AAD8NQ65_TARER|nr:hypothetical protein QVD17_26491 [Tagetes erecta]